MSIGIGLAVNNTRAVFEALFNQQSEFARTPKYRIEARADEWIGKKYRQSFVVQPMIELALGLYFTATVFYALANGIYGTVPFLVLFQIGFLYTGLLSIIQQFAGDDVVLKAVTEEESKFAIQNSECKMQIERGLHQRGERLRSSTPFLRCGRYLHSAFCILNSRSRP